MKQRIYAADSDDAFRTYMIIQPGTPGIATIDISFLDYKSLQSALLRCIDLVHEACQAEE